MTIFNLGSINADLVYHLPHLPAPGETLVAGGLVRGLGGKGANMSVAAARAGARAVHIGAVGPDGAWAVERLMEYGVDTRHIARVPDATGHAVILLEPGGENSIVVHPGANAALQPAMVDSALSEARDGDLFITQNETTAQVAAAQSASARGMRVAYAAAPFAAHAVEAVLPVLDLLVLNAVEAAQLTDALGKPLDRLGVADVIVTLGADGCDWYATDRGQVTRFDAIEVDALDTTGAGDTFTGYLLAGMDRGMPMAQAIQLATRAAALMVTRVGTADVIPDLLEVQQMPR
jgi:ribokinase